MERLIAEFGEPWRVGQNFRWSIECTPHAPVNISLDSWREPDRLAVWVFNPSKSGPGGVWYSKISQNEEIEEFIGALRTQLSEIRPDRGKGS